MAFNGANKFHKGKKGYTKLNNTNNDRLGPLISGPQQNGILQTAYQPIEEGPPDVFQVNNQPLPVEPAPPEQQQPKGRLLQQKQVTTFSYNYFIFTLIFLQTILYVSIYAYNRLANA